MKFKLIPWYYIDSLSYGQVEYFMNEFRSWLCRLPKGYAVVIPDTATVKDQFTIALSSGSIKEIANSLNIFVTTEHRLKRKGVSIRPTQQTPVQQPEFRLNIIFEQLVVVENELFLVN